jgi:hypothetical protein
MPKKTINQYSMKQMLILELRALATLSMDEDKAKLYMRLHLMHPGYNIGTISAAIDNISIQAPLHIMRAMKEN